MLKTKSPILEAVHDTATGLHKAGVMNQVTLREFDRLCLPAVGTLEPAQIKDIDRDANDPIGRDTPAHRGSGRRRVRR